jgi:hypothetical protein
VFTPDQKGAIAEAAIIYAATKLGIGVSRPLRDERYDLIFDFGTSLARVQCKWVVRRGAVIVIPCRSCRRTRDGFDRRPYTEAEIDAVAAYCASVDRCFFLPPELFARRSAVQLRLGRALNNQKLRINWADAFDFTATLREAIVGP